MYEISQVQTEQELREVWKLTHDEFLRSNYITEQEDGIFRYGDKWDLENDRICNHSVTIICKKDGILVGTISMTFDSELGLPVDTLYVDIINQYRDKNWKLGCVWRLIIRFKEDKECLKLLLSAIFNVAITNNLDFCFLEVNPKHVKFYTKLFKMKQCSEIKYQGKLSNSPPSVLLVWSKESKDHWIKNRKRLGIKE